MDKYVVTSQDDEVNLRLRWCFKPRYVFVLLMFTMLRLQPGVMVVKRKLENLSFWWIAFTCTTVNIFDILAKRFQALWPLELTGK